MGCQGSSVPEDRTEAGVRCCSGRWVDLTRLPPALSGIGAQSQKMIFGHWQSWGWGGEGQIGGEDPGVLTPCLEPLWTLHADEQPGVAGRMVLTSCRLCWEGVGWHCLHGCLSFLFPAQHPGGIRGSTVLSHPSSDAQTNCWATVRLYTGQDFLEFPRLVSCQKQDLLLLFPPLLPAPALLCCHITHHPSKLGQF